MLFISDRFIIKSETEGGPEYLCRINTQCSYLALESHHTKTTQNQRPELPTVTLTWHASKYKVLHAGYVLIQIIIIKKNGNNNNNNLSITVIRKLIVLLRNNNDDDDHND